MPVVFAGTNLKLYSGSFGMHKAKYQIRYKSSDGKQVRQIVPKGEDAVEWAKEMDAQLNRVSHLNESGYLYRDLVELYISELEQQVQNYRTDLSMDSGLRHQLLRKTWSIFKVM